MQDCVHLPILVLMLIIIFFNVCHPLLLTCTFDSLNFIDCLFFILLDPRPAAQVSLVLQNLFVILNVATIYLFLEYQDQVLSYSPWAKHAVYALIIVLSILSLLASVARKIAVEKDWIVEICEGDNDKLASKKLLECCQELNISIFESV